MSAVTPIKDEAGPIADNDLSPGQTHDDAAASYTWLDEHTAAGNSKPVEDDIDFIEIDVDNVPTLYDVYEQTFVFSPGESDDDVQQNAHVLVESADDLPEVEALYSAFAINTEADKPATQEELVVAQHADHIAALAESHDDTSQLPIYSMEDLFNQVRRDPVLLQRALLGLSCVFQLIAVAALWRAVGDKVVTTELVPPLVYASIGIVAYLLGMRYLRIHFAQVRVGDKDWVLCEQVMVAADNGVMLKARFGTAYLIWEQLLGVAQDSDYYYLLIEHSQGFKVPKQGVSDPGLQIKLDDMASLTKAKALQYN